MKYNTLPITCFLSFALFQVVSAEIFHVDSQSGNDAADGKMPQTAWKSLEKVNKAEIQPGDMVRFKRGGHWRGQLQPKSGEEGKPVVYTNYGEEKNGIEKKPSLLGSVALNDESDWSKQGDNLWATEEDQVYVEKTVDGFTDLGWSIHTEGGAEATFSSSKNPKFVPSDEKEKNFMRSCSVQCKASGTKSNHIQLIVRGFKVEAGKYYLLRLNGSSEKPFTIPSIRLSEPDAPWGGLGSTVRQPGEITSRMDSHEVLFRCDRSHDNARLTISVGGAMPEGETLFIFFPELYEAKVETNGIDADVGNIILDGSKAAFKKWTLEDLKNEDDFWYDLETNRVFYRSTENPAKRFKSIEAALHRHVVNHSNCQYVVFDGLDIRYGAAHGFGGTKARNCVYRNLDISWIGGADQYRGGGKGRRVRFGNGIEFWSDASDCLVEHCKIWEIYDAALTNQGSGVNVERNITYRNNLIWNSEYSFEYWNRGPESITDNVVFENNACFDAGYGWGYVQRPNPNGRHIMIYSNTAKTTNFVIRNNVFCNAKDSLVRIDADFRLGLSMENNQYWQIEGNELFYWLAKERFKINQFAEYQEKVGLDKTSVLRKPDFSRFPDLPKSVRR